MGRAWGTPTMGPNGVPGGKDKPTCRKEAALNQVDVVSSMFDQKQKAKNKKRKDRLLTAHCCCCCDVVVVVVALFALLLLLLVG